MGNKEEQGISMQKLLVLSLSALVVFNTYAHSGRTDSSGGHNCSAKSVNKGLCSGYHYHNSGSTTQAVKPKHKSTYSTKYNRKNWTHWVDYDNDCQDARAEILIRDSLEPVKFKRNKGCRVTWGKWLDPYTLRTYTKASDIDIDHIVPLAHAHYSGAANWTKKQKRTFANDPENLLSVEDNANQEKSAKAPHQWMPENSNYHCTYLKKWQHIKAKYNLKANEQERAFIALKINHCR